MRTQAHLSSGHKSAFSLHIPSDRDLGDVNGVRVGLGRPRKDGEPRLGGDTDGRIVRGGDRESGLDVLMFYSHFLSFSAFVGVVSLGPSDLDFVTQFGSLDLRAFLGSYSLQKVQGGEGEYEDD